MSVQPHLGAQRSAVFKAPRTFKVIDVASGVVLAGATDSRAIDVLAGIDSFFDVCVYVWHPPARSMFFTASSPATAWIASGDAGRRR